MKSYLHRVKRVAPGCYRLSWTVDRPLKGRMWPQPIRYTRETDLAGASRFAKRWNLTNTSSLPEISHA